ncbi:MAG: ATP-binding protein [Desulfobacterales bacterium]|nr:ATP-binding protein [Desulfobacterales bacterium]
MNEKEKAENPFGTKKPVSGKSFIGRERLLREINNLLNRNECISMVGERRTGKTSILHHILELKKQQHTSYHDYIFVFFDFHDKSYSKESGVWISILSELLKEIERLELEKKYLLELLDSLKTGEFEDSFSDDLADLLINYGSMGWKFCFLFDEFEKTVNMFDIVLRFWFVLA